MKKIIMTLALALGVFPALAQEKPLISSAILADRNGEMALAVRYINEADSVINHKGKASVDQKLMAKFLFHKGMIFTKVATGNKEEAKQKAPNAVEDALQAFKDLHELEKGLKKPKYLDKMALYTPALLQLSSQKAFSALNKQDFAKAKDAFLETYNLGMHDIMGAQARQDTTMLYNAALMSEQGKDWQGAIKLYKELLDMGYKGITYSATNVETGEPMVFASKQQMEQFVKNDQAKDPKIGESIQADIYLSLYRAYLMEKDTDKAAEVMTKARKLFPSNPDLIRAELQIFLEKKEYDKAMNNLELAIESDPDNHLFHYVKGQILHTEMKEMDKAKASYERAIEIEPDFQPALYMAGLMQVDKANEIVRQMNDLPLNATKKYKEMDKQKEQAFKEALPYFEKAYKADPTDADTIKALWEVYRKLGNYEKSKEMEEKLQAIGGQ